MNKTVLRTSLVWTAILALVVGVISFRHTRKQQPSSSRDAEVLASGPEPSAAGTAAQAPPSLRTSDPPLTPVQLSPDQAKAIGIATATAEYKHLRGDIVATGTVAADERLLSYVHVRFAGYIRKVFADATYQYVRKGQPLFTIYIPDVVATEQEYLLARENERTLTRSSVEGVAQGAAALTAAAEQRLQQWNIPDAELSRLQETGKASTDITVNSEVTGYITERNAVSSLYVEPSTRLYTVADLSRVWVNAQVFQEDIGLLKPGDPAFIAVDSYPGRTLKARIEQILPNVEMATRTVPVRLSVPNPGTRLKPGMFVNVTLESAAGEQLTVPASAVFQTGQRQLVFVDDGRGTYTPKDVVLGRTDGGEVAIVRGLGPHERVVTSANFLLDSESQLQAAAGTPIGTPSTQASPSGGTLGRATITFSTEPDPPHKGANVLRVKLTGTDGKALDGAQVSVTFFMPAMPAMGMAAMKTTSSLLGKGGGLYQGSGELGSGGSWQVTITAQQNGSIIAVKQMRIDAQGGM